jgi:putative PIN family toxin of toxin-antitoxin system
MLKILADTNVLISALLYPESKPALALFQASVRHKLVLTEYNILELRRIAEAKFAKTQSDIDLFFTELSFELIPAADAVRTTIRDPKDQPILNAAIAADVDVILTGDKDFLSLNLVRPRTMSAAQFIELEGLKH